MKIVYLAATAALLAGCEAVPVAWRPELVPVVLVPAETPPAAKPRKCRPLPRDVMVEAHRVTLLDTADSASADFTAALMVSEVKKNQRLREAAKAYEACRRG